PYSRRRGTRPGMGPGPAAAPSTEEPAMAKCMFAVTYSPEGAQGLVKDGGTRRRAYIAELIAGLGAKLEAFYYAFGDTDVITIVDAPDTATIAALSLAVNASG